MPNNHKQTRKCTVCGKIKSIEAFYKSTSIKDGYRNQCKSCMAQYNKTYASLNIEKSKKYHANYGKNYYEKNKEELKRKRRDYYKKNKESILESAKIYKINNMDKVREIMNLSARNYSRRKRKNDPMYKLSTNFSRSIRGAIKGKKNGKHWPDLVGYSMEQLRKHLEKQFTHEMNWSNYGTYWHVDHIIPVSAFNFISYRDLDFKKCWSLKNLRPLEAKDNIRKSNKLERPFQPSISFRQ